MSTRHTSQMYLVSPYIRATDFDPNEYGIVTPCKMIWDDFHERQLLVSMEVYDFIAAASVDARRISSTELFDSAPEPEFLVAAELVILEDDGFAKHRYRHVEVEINRHCNYRCRFCPVSHDPKPMSNMSMEMFSLCIDRIVEYGATVISLNHYSEPTLHPHFVEFCELAVARGLFIRLHSNVSALNEAKIASLARLKEIAIIVNLPTLDHQAFYEVTKSRALPRVLRNVDALHAAGIRVILAVNTTDSEERSVLDDINARFRDSLGKQRRWRTNDRAGLLQLATEYAPPVQHKNRLVGCALALDQISISYDGKVFLCCQDYHQTYVLGQVCNASLREIVESETAVQLRKKILGASEATGSLICSRCTKTQSFDSAQPFKFGGLSARQVDDSQTFVSPSLVTATDIAAHFSS